MDLRTLRYFAAVATARNFTRAAEKLGIAQPPLSRQVRELEEELGLPLFDRRSRPVALTEAGHVLLEHANHVLASVDRLHGAMRRLKSGDRKRFTIGFVGSTIYGPVPILIRQFRLAAPELHVDLVEMTTLAQIQALIEGRIDAGLGRLTFEDPAIRRRVIEHERLVVAVATGHRFAGDAAPIALAALRTETLILYPSDPRPSYADQLLAILRDYDVHPTDVREVRELQTALGLVAADAGIAIVPASIQRLKRDDIVYRPVAEAGAVSPIILSWRVADQSPAMELLGELAARL